ncbi:hypothetical protein CMMCAS08_01455 [Clavibacter michiganensis subsp. michiganensis]|nr:hypothetical protein CMMCAS08_01455 [Clavibacter michiganensis subsp. michiganensis]
MGTARADGPRILRCSPVPAADPDALPVTIPEPRVSDAPDAHPDAARLLDLWRERWPEPYPPYSGWYRPGMRFHTLPWGRQEARQARDRRAARRRYASVVTTLERLTGVRGTLVIELWRGGLRESDTVLPGLVSWAVFTEPSASTAEDVEDWTQEFRIRVGRPPLGDLCDLGHQEEGRYLLVAEDMTWTVCCYDGGIDVSMLDAAVESALVDAHERWLPPDSWVVEHAWMRAATRGDLRRKALVARRNDIRNARWHRKHDPDGTLGRGYGED